ncbi:hypothetical protein IFM89_004829 [Coptis chinensis]|uniref:Protein kinase domain-containing protein n=1 Tax=Coptis chinensis TaxID=261450 RepID=A0A835H3J4_9MAGN|nr:hypothetical protein IFM89_004829 [Coptis chinensis]
MEMSLAHYVILPFFFLLSHPVPHSAQESKQNRGCHLFSCGNLREVGFPFSNITNPECGLSVMNCTGPQPKVQFHEQGKWYPVNYINYVGRSIIIHDQDVQTQLESVRCDSLSDFTVQVSPFLSINVTDTSPLFKCKRENSPIPPYNFFHKFLNHSRCGDYDLYFTLKKFYHPFPKLSIQLFIFPQQEFQLLTFRQSHRVLPGAVIIVVAILVALRKKAKNSILPWKKKTATTKHIEAFFKNHGMPLGFTPGSLAPKQYQYKEVQIMTRSFKNKLGQGGYGSVFKGMLKDGRSVAVKVLCETKGNGEEFINEVASISRTSHVNIVSLLGYCFEGSKRALVYEYMSNGSLEKYIYVEKPPEPYSHLGWETLHQIAVGIARGLEYLHRGCNTRILHFDIKPHNILLDEEFCPKISDFGLAKLCSRKESIVSMLGGRGTIGYIAPEVFSRNFGGISHKSDVYSYGMMILEMVGARNNIAVAVDHTSEKYFPSWIYKRIELDEDLELHGVLSQAERQMTRKMILVGLWCIQTNPSDRPSMSRVLEMLEGSVEVLSIPPKPFLSSPPRGQEDTSNN